MATDTDFYVKTSVFMNGAAFEVALFSMAASVAAHAGGGQGSATQLSKMHSVITTCDTPNDSVRLPDPLDPGLTYASMYYVSNYTANNLAIYPTSGGQINNIAVNGFYTLVPMSTIAFINVDLNSWFTFGGP